MIVLTIIGVAIMFALGMMGAAFQRHGAPILGVSLSVWFWLAFAGLCFATAVFASLGQTHLAFNKLTFFSMVAALACSSLALGSNLLVDISKTNVVGRVVVFCLAAAPLAFMGASLLFIYMWSFAETMP